MSWYEIVAGVILPAPVEGNEPARADGWRCRRRVPAQADRSNPFGRADDTSPLGLAVRGSAGGGLWPESGGALAPLDGQRGSV